ncbi:MAG: hypothetical protein AAF089_08565 [Bacteroidota bacterium]
MRLVITLALLVPLAALAQPGLPQPPVPPDSLGPPTFMSGAGLAIRLTNDGFGVGGVLRAEVGETTSLFIEASVNPGKDEREQQFFIGFFGETVVPLKRNYFAMMPVHAGVEQRLFRDSIEDNFRPFFQIAAGPTFGYQWPYFEDTNRNGVRNEGESLEGAFGGFGDGSFRMGLGGTISVGAYFGRSRRTTQGLRIGYHGTYFFDQVDLLELNPDVQDPSKHYFGTPLVSVHLLRLW